MNCVAYKNDGPYGGSIEISGTTCNGVTGMFYLNYGETICMNVDRPLFTCDYFKIEGNCLPPTPSVTPSITPTNTMTPTNTLTPSPTSTVEPICPQQINVMNTGFSGFNIYNGVYERVYTYSGGTMTGGFFTTPSSFIAGPDSFGKLSACYVRFSAGTYYNLVVINQSTPSNTNRYVFVRTTGSSLYDGGSVITPVPIVSEQIQSGGIYYPKPGQGFGFGSPTAFYISYPESCPTPTPTNTATFTPTPSRTPTLTPTSTITPTPSSTVGTTPSPTPSVTATMTQTPTITNTNTPSVTPSNSPTPSITASPTNTQTPSVTPTSTPTGTPQSTPTMTQTPTATFSCTNCNDWYYDLVPTVGDVIHYYSCQDGSSQTIVVSEFQSGNFCNCDSVGLPYSDYGTFLTQVGICLPPPTPSVTPSNTPTISVTPSNTPTPSETPTGGQLFVYARYINSSQEFGYSINGGPYLGIGEPTSSSCLYAATISGLQLGDIVTFTTLLTCSINGDTADCPNSTGSCSFSHFFSGTQNIYITVDASQCC